jgi:hypothetical protein
MPFKKVGSDDYTSPSGRHFNGAQVRLYYAHGGHFPGEAGHAGGGVVNKGYMSKTESFAQGGVVLGRTKDFMKTPDTFREEGGKATDEVYGKGSKAPRDHVAAPPAKGKTLKAVTPKK